MKIIFIVIAIVSILALIFWGLGWVFLNAIDKYVDYSNDSSLEDVLGSKPKDQDWDDNKQHTEQNV